MVWATSIRLVSGRTVTTGCVMISRASIGQLPFDTLSLDAPLKYAGPPRSFASPGLSSRRPRSVPWHRLGGGDPPEERLEEILENGPPVRDDASEIVSRPLGTHGSGTEGPRPDGSPMSIGTDVAQGPPAFWSVPAEDLLLHLRSTPQGLSAEEARRRPIGAAPRLHRTGRRAHALMLLLA